MPSSPFSICMLKCLWCGVTNMKILGLKTNDPPVAYSLEWKVIDKGKTFNPITGVCRLCLKEKFHILNNPEAITLNSREEVFTPCQHKFKFLLKNAHI